MKIGTPGAVRELARQIEFAVLIDGLKFSTVSMEFMDELGTDVFLKANDGSLFRQRGTCKQVVLVFSVLKVLDDNRVMESKTAAEFLFFIMDTDKVSQPVLPFWEGQVGWFHQMTEILAF